MLQIAKVIYEILQKKIRTVKFILVVLLSLISKTSITIFFADMKLVLSTKKS